MPIYCFISVIVVYQNLLLEETVSTRYIFLPLFYACAWTMNSLFIVLFMRWLLFYFFFGLRRFNVHICNIYLFVFVFVCSSFVQDPSFTYKINFFMLEHKINSEYWTIQKTNKNQINANTFLFWRICEHCIFEKI